MSTAIAAMLVLGMLSGCYSANVKKSMQSWVGRSRTDLIAHMGPPAHEESDGAGGTLLVYEDTRSWTTGGYSHTQSEDDATFNATAIDTRYTTNVWGTASGEGTSQTFYVPPQQHTSRRVRSFFIGADGIIYNVAWNGG